MKYLYYPGCSLEGTALEYNVSTHAVMQELGAELVEVEDWTCCGASAAEPTSFILSFVLPARNLALAEKMDEDADILAPCSACYLNLKKVEGTAQNHPDFFSKIKTVLFEEQLQLKGKVRVKHLLEVIANDIGPETIQPLVKKPFKDFIIAPYYGCQCLRPYPVFDDPEKPRSMEPVIEAIGANVYNWDMGGKCCGASHMSTKPDVGIELVTAILKAAKGADAIITVCPMCQMNLEAHQKKASRISQEDLEITILYLPQLIGLALGLKEKDLRLDLNLSVTEKFREKLRSVRC